MAEHGGFTTNAEDLANAAEMKARLQKNEKQSSSLTAQKRLPSVEIASGTHKYVLIKANLNGEDQFIVTSRQNAQYHMNAAEPMVAALEAAGYSNIDILGGGRIKCNEEEKTMKIYGFSYGFGLADHAISQGVVKEDSRYKDYEISTSNEGY